MSKENESCKITINNEQFYIACDKQKDIVLDNGRLTNRSSGSTTLYKTLYTDYTSYPYINCSFGSVCYRVNSNSSSRQYLTSIQKVSYSNRPLDMRYNEYVLYTVLFIFLIILWKYIYK